MMPANGSKISLIISRAIIVFLLMITVIPVVEGQGRPAKREAPPLRERMYLGGNFGLQFGTFTYVEISPIVGVWLLPRLSVAAGPTFKYYKDSYGSSDVWGGKVYTRFVIINDLNNLIPIGMGTSIYAHGEFESLSFKSDYLGITNGSLRTTVNTGLAGGGFSQPLGGRSRLNFAVLWVVYDSGYQMYNNPEYRLEFTFGF